MHHSLEPPDTVQLPPQGSGKPSRCLTPQLSLPGRACCLPCRAPKWREGCSPQGLRHWHCHPEHASGQALPMPPSGSTHPCGTEPAAAASRGSARDGDPQPRWGYPPGRTATGVSPQFPLPSRHNCMQPCKAAENLYLGGNSLFRATPAPQSPSFPLQGWAEIPSSLIPLLLWPRIHRNLGFYSLSSSTLLATPHVFLYRDAMYNLMRYLAAVNYI